MTQGAVWVIVCTMGGLGGCGSDPAPEAPVPPALTRIDQVPRGAHCADGGIAIRSGIDRNRNGVLDDAEIDHTEYACNGAPDIWTGDFTSADWMDPQKVSALSNLRVVLGSLALPANIPVLLPALEYVAGNLEIGDSASSEVKLPALQAIGGDLNVRGALAALHLDHLGTIAGGIALAPQAAFQLALPSLVSIGGSLQSTLSPVTAIDLPAVERVRGSVSLDGMPMLVEVSMPRIVEIRGSLVLAGMPALSTLDIAQLVAVGRTFYVSNLPALHALQLPSLRELAGLDVVIAVTGVEELDFPALEDSQACPVFAANPQLRSVSFPVLTHMICLSIYDSPPLASVTAPMIDQLDGLNISGGGQALTLDFTALSRVRTFVALRTASLADLSGLRALTDADELIIDHIDQLPDLRGLSALQNLSSLQIMSNPAMTSLAGLENVTRLATRVDIIDNAALRSLGGLQNITSLGAVNFDNDPMLTGLELPSLLSIDDFLGIGHMASLASLSGLDPLRSVAGNIYIADDPMLSEEEIAAFRARF